MPHAPIKVSTFQFTKAPELCRNELLHEIFERSAAAAEGQIALACGDERMTYGELEQRANQLARHLRSLGVTSGSHVALLLPRSMDVYVALLAALKAGAAYVPLDPDYPADRVEYILADVKADVLVTVSAQRAQAGNFAGRIVILDHDLKAIAGEPHDTKAVMVGWDVDFGRAKLQIAAEALLAGAELYCASDVPFFASQHRLNVGVSGFIASGLEYVSGQKREVLGKPSHDAVKLFFVAAYCALELLEWLAQLAGHIGKCAGVFRQTRSTPTWASRQKLGADAWVKANDFHHLVHIGASLPGPGHVAQTGGHGLILGELDNAVTERARAIAQVLDCGGLPTQVSTSIRDDIWSKLVGNISTNPLSVVTGATLDRLFNEPGLRRLVTAVMLETMTVGAGYGVRFALDPAQRIDLGRRLGAFRTSMLQDFDRGRPLELGAIVDAVLELAERIGVPMPMTTLVRDLADVAQRSARLLQETT